MNQLILFCIVIIVIEIVLLYKEQTQENYAYKKFDAADNTNSMSCQRLKEYNTVWNGYQTGTSPQPPVYWPEKKFGRGPSKIVAKLQNIRLSIRRETVSTV